MLKADEAKVPFPYTGPFAGARRMIYRLHPDYPELFPDPEADPEGLVAVGGDLSVRRLLAAYGAGIFPWFWPPCSGVPDPGASCFRKFRIRIPSVRNTQVRLSVTNQAFCDVMRDARLPPRPDQTGRGSCPNVDAYASLHELGLPIPLKCGA